MFQDLDQANFKNLFLISTSTLKEEAMNKIPFAIRSLLICGYNQ